MASSAVNKKVLLPVRATYWSTYRPGWVTIRSEAVMDDLRYLKEWLRSTTSPGSTDRDGDELVEEFDQFFSHIFNNSDDGISILDCELTILGVNSAMERWYQSKRPLVGSKCYVTYHERSKPCDNCPSIYAMKSGRPHVGAVPYEGAGRRHGTQELSVFPLFDNNTRVFGLLEYVRDISRDEAGARAVDNLKKRIQFQEQTLREQGVALEVMLRQGQRSERRLAQTVTGNISSFVEPLIERMRSRLSGTDSAEDLELLAARLKSITAPYLEAIAIEDRGLTRREKEIAALIHEGKSTKEIARILGVSLKTVDYHRANLRRKLDLTGSGERLESFLSRQVKHQVFPGT